LIALTPPGWTAVLAKALGDGNAVSAFTPLLLLLSAGSLSVWAAHRISLREARRPEQVRRSEAGPAPRAGWQLPFGPPALSALFEKELKTLMRAGWLQFVIVPAGFLLLRTAFMGARIDSFGAQPLLIAAAYAHLGVLDVATNAFGRDLGAARAYFLWPVDRRLLFAAKNACAYLFSLAIFALLCGVQAFAGQLSLQHVLVGLLAHAATFPALAAFGNASSVLWPVPQRTVLLRRVRSAGPIGARLFAVALLGGIAWAPYAIAKVSGLPVLVAYAGALAASGVAYGGLLALSVAMFESRKESLLAALARDE
jgi:hypothetical protein